MIITAREKDSVTAGEIIDILKTLAKDKNKCVIVVTHSKEVADSADIILELSGKKLKKVNKITNIITNDFKLFLVT